MNEDILKFAGVMVTLMTVGIFGYAGVTVVGAFSRRLNRGPQPPTIDPNEVEMLRSQLTDVEDLKARVAELEERVDFSERLLAQRQAGSLPGSPD